MDKRATFSRFILQFRSLKVSKSHHATDMPQESGWLSYIFICVVLCGGKGCLVYHYDADDVLRSISATLYRDVDYLNKPTIARFL